MNPTSHCPVLAEDDEGGKPLLGSNVVIEQPALFGEKRNPANDRTAEYPD